MTSEEGRRIQTRHEVERVGEPFVQSTPSNPRRDGRDLAVEPGTRPIEKVARSGDAHHLNDGALELSEDGRDGERKAESWWGCEWPRQYTVDRVVSTTGDVFADGGWFAGDLRVQVRRDHRRRDIDRLRVTPAYPYARTAGARTSHAFAFAATAADGVRLVGRPGGRRTYTSIAEPAVYHGSSTRTQ